MEILAELLFDSFCFVMERVFRIPIRRRRPNRKRILSLKPGWAILVLVIVFGAALFFANFLFGLMRG